jgi:hypothetical protein
MTTPRDINTYGGIFVDAFTVAVPKQEQSSSFANRANADLAEMSRTTTFGFVLFTTTATAGPVAATVTAGRSHMGSGSGQWPTVQKTATGLYTVTYPTSFNDDLLLAENVSLTSGTVALQAPTAPGFVFIDTIVTNVVHVKVYNASSSLADLAGSTVALFVV